MANIRDYLQWRGDITFAERPFNDVDNLVLSALVYLDFTGIVPTEEQGGSVRVSEACRRLLSKAGGNVAPYVRSFAKVDTRFAELVAASTRFGGARLCAYADVVDQDRSLQFAAVQVMLPDAGVYVAFRGTDDTLVGWRENFMLSFEVTEAQHEAARYLERVLERTGATGEPVRVGGHSKGGNLAEYAAMACPSPKRNRIIRAYTNDGPGMPPEVLGTNEHLGTALRRIVPSYSIVGMLFSNEDDTRTVVASSASGIEQHDITTWQVTRSGLEEAGRLHPDCMVLNRAIARWAAGIPLNERERVTMEVFDALGAGGATRVGQLASPEGIQQVLRALASVSGHTYGAAGSFVQSTVRTAAQRILPSNGITVRFSRSGKRLRVE